VSPARRLSPDDWAAVNRLFHEALELPAHEIGRWHDDVVAGIAGEEFGFEHFVRIEHVVVDGDAGLALEVRDGVGCDVVRPVVDVQYRLLGYACGGRGIVTAAGEGERTA